MQAAARVVGFAHPTSLLFAALQVSHYSASRLRNSPIRHRETASGLVPHFSRLVGLPDLAGLHIQGR